MFKRYFDDLRLEHRGRRCIEAKYAKWEVKYAYPLKYLNAQMDSAHEFINTVCSMLKECDLQMEYMDGIYIAKLEIPYHYGEENEAYDHQTFGYIFKTDVLLDCTMVYDRMRELGKKPDRYKQRFFNRLFRTGILRHPCLHPLQYKWFRKNGDIIPEEDDHKFYCIPNSVLTMSAIATESITTDTADFIRP